MLLNIYIIWSYKTCCKFITTEAAIREGSSGVLVFPGCVASAWLLWSQTIIGGGCGVYFFTAIVIGFAGYSCLCLALFCRGFLKERKKLCIWLNFCSWLLHVAVRFGSWHAWQCEADSSMTGFGNLRTANWRTGNMRTNSANYGREPRVQCEPESANFLCN